jgi:transposase-like protein
MSTPEIEAEIRRLVLRDGWKIETTARRFGVHHSVVRRVLRQANELHAARVSESKLDPFKGFVVEQLGQYPELTGSRLYAQLKERGYTGGVAVLRRFAENLRRKARDLPN